MSTSYLCPCTSHFGNPEVGHNPVEPRWALSNAFCFYRYYHGASLPNCGGRPNKAWTSMIDRPVYAAETHTIPPSSPILADHLDIYLSSRPSIQPSKIAKIPFAQINSIDLCGGGGGRNRSELMRDTSEDGRTREIGCIHHGGKLTFPRIDLKSRSAQPRSMVAISKTART